MDEDHTPAINKLAAKKLAERELRDGPVANPTQWLKAVVQGIRIDHAGRLATMPMYMSIHDQVKWIENGAPPPGARIPPPSTPTDFGNGKARIEVVQAELAKARAFLRKDKPNGNGENAGLRGPGNGGAGGGEQCDLIA